jgi:hypothetical protein
MRDILETAKTLTVAFGPREAARQLNMPAGRVLKWAFRYGWKQATVTESKRNRAPFSPSETLQSAIENHKTRSTLALGKYAAEAAEEAAQRRKGAKLGVSRKVRDVAAIHATLWPAEKHSSLLFAGVLTGEVKIEDA